MKSRIVSALCAVVVLGGLAGAAEADQYRYVGVHPIVEAAGGGVCYIELPHVHVYAPSKVKVEYRDHDGWHHFVGDPVAYGYEGPKHSYHGAHPIHVDVVVEDDWHDDHHVEWCYLKGPHYHWYEPGVAADFKVEGDVYWYVGDYPPAFRRRHPRYARINAVYEPITYVRPVVEVEPPHGYVDILVVGGPGVVVEGRGRAHGRVRSGAHIDVEVPMPRIEVGIGASVGVGHHHHRRHRHKKHKKYKRYKKHKKHRKFRKFRGRH